jgi:hypothetical protein
VVRKSVPCSQPVDSFHCTADYRAQQPDRSLYTTNNLVVSSAFGQAAQSQLAVENLQPQQQLRMAYEEHLKATTVKQAVPYTDNTTKPRAMNPSRLGPPVVATNKSVSELSPAMQLRQNYEAHLASLRELSLEQPNPTASTDSRLKQRTALTTNSQSPAGVLQAKAESMLPPSTSEPAARETSSKKETPKDHATGSNSGLSVDDHEAGTILLGFINSLRRSFEDAVVQTVEISRENEDAGTTGKAVILGRSAAARKAPSKRETKSRPRSPGVTNNIVTANHTHKNLRLMNGIQPNSFTHTTQVIAMQLQAMTSSVQARPASVTDASTVSKSGSSCGTSSQPNESASSIDDSDSKSDKTDPSSTSEESEEKDVDVHRSQGPPRKRLKSKRVQEFTTQNVLEHCKRMTDLPRKNGKADFGMG